MANLTDDSGQLILVTAVALAVVFIALAVVANSAIYTETLASRGDTTGSTEALQTRGEVVEDVGSVIIGVNQFNTSSTGSDRGDSLRAGIRNTDAALSRQASTENRFIGVEYDSHSDGTRIYDNTSGGSTFVEESTGNTDWEVVDNTQVRRFQMSLQTGDIDESLSGPDEFNILVSVGGDPASASAVYEIHIGEDGSGDDTIAVMYPSSPTRTCNIERGGEPQVYFDLSRAVANGQHCEPLAAIWESIGTNDYWITFRNGDAVQGQYTLTAEDDGIPKNNNPETDDPSYSRAVYSTTVEFRYDTPQTIYQTDVRVAPGEPRD